HSERSDRQRAQSTAGGKRMCPQLPQRCIRSSPFAAASQKEALSSVGRGRGFSTPNILPRDSDLQRIKRIKRRAPEGFLEENAPFFEMQFRKIEQQSNRKAGRLQVWDQLCLVMGSGFFPRLESILD